MIRPVAFVLREVHDSIRNGMPVCPVGTRFFVLVPALTPSAFPTVIAAKINFPPLLATGAVFCPGLMNRIGLLPHLGLEGMCHPEDDEPCICYHNGVEMNERLSLFNSADFVSCYKGRSFTMMDNSACRWYFLSRQPNKAWWPGLLKTFCVSVRRGFLDF